MRRERGASKKVRKRGRRRPGQQREKTGETSAADATDATDATEASEAFSEAFSEAEEMGSTGPA